RAAHDQRRALDLFPLRHLNRPPVEHRAGALSTFVKLVHRWVKDDADGRPPFYGEAYRYGELRNAFNELARAVDRIDDPDPLGMKPREIILAFFREPAVVGIFAEQDFLDLRIRLEVGYRDGIIFSLLFDAVFLAEIPHQALRSAARACGTTRIIRGTSGSAARVEPATKRRTRSLRLFQ